MKPFIAIALGVLMVMSLPVGSVSAETKDAFGRTSNHVLSDSDEERIVDHFDQTILTWKGSDAKIHKWKGHFAVVMDPDEFHEHFNRVRFYVSQASVILRPLYLFGFSSTREYKKSNQIRIIMGDSVDYVLDKYKGFLQEFPEKNKEKYYDTARIGLNLGSDCVVQYVFEDEWIVRSTILIKNKDLNKNFPEKCFWSSFYNAIGMLGNRKGPDLESIVDLDSSRRNPNTLDNISIFMLYNSRLEAGLDRKTVLPLLRQLLRDDPGVVAYVESSMRRSKRLGR